MLKDRVLTSLVALPLLVSLFYFDARLGQRAALYSTFILVLTGFAAAELVAMLRNVAPRIQRFDVVATSVLMVAAGHRVLMFREAAPDERVSPAFACLAVATTFAIGVLLMAVADLNRYERGSVSRDEILPTFAAKLLATAYVGGGLALGSQLRWEPHGYRWLAIVLVSVKTADIGAYFVGRIVGGPHPLQRLSPGKTLSGFIGGLVTGAAAGAGLGGVLFEDDVFDNFAWGAVVCLIFASLGIIGDLVESLLKRGCGVKDSGSSLPGFGGLLDLIDSPLFATAAFVLVSMTVSMISNY